MNSEEQFEYIENKIKAAAENNQPVFEEQAWTKMEALLDKDKKRRPFVWLWFLVPLFLAGGLGSYLLFHNNSLKNNTSNIKVDININDKNNRTVQPSSNNHPATHLQNNKIPSSKKSYNTVNVDRLADVKNQQPVKNYFSAKNNKIFITEPASTDAALKEVTEKKLIVLDGLYKINPVSPSETNAADAFVKQKINDSLQTKTKQINIITPDTSIAKITNNAAKKQRKKGNGFYLLASAGADMGSVKLVSFKNNSLSAKYGVGLGYQLNKKWSVQTGFYISRKKYLAAPGDYHPKQGSYWNMVQLTKVEANCLIYEIPLAVRYNFTSKPVTNYYATVGLSSYIMKKEDYNYYYIRNNVPGKSAWTYRGNKNLFSILTLSAGLERKINEKLSIQAEPSIGIPIAGVGDGRVKIFSTALQLGLKYQPIKKH